MQTRLIPVLMVVLAGGGALFLITRSAPTTKSMSAPEVAPFVDVEGIETEVAIAPDGVRYAVISSGDLWYIDLIGDTPQQLTETVEAESAPAWTQDGGRITFTRGQDTFAMDPETRRDEPYLADARHMVWSVTGQLAFVRDRALWIRTPEATEAEEVVPADPEPNVTIISPRFSPDGSQIVFIRSTLGLRGEVWKTDLASGSTVPVIADRDAENPTSVDWLADEGHLVYLTDRAGGLAVWYVDLETPSLLPLTAPLMDRSIAPLGIAARGDRIVIPRHFLDSDIATLDGRRLIASDRLEFEPSASPNGERIAYTVAEEGRFETWIADRNGENAQYIDLGRHPRFSPSGNALVYSQTGLDGNTDIWRFDLTSGTSERLTDHPEIDDAPDWSPDGRSIVFHSNRGGRFSLWRLPASGGRRSRLPTEGFAPRYSRDGNHIAFWNQGRLWTLALEEGASPTEVAAVREPVFAAWNDTGPAYFSEGAIQDDSGSSIPHSMWEVFDRHPDGGWLVSDLQVERAELWTLDLVFVEEQ